MQKNSYSISKYFAQWLIKVEPQLLKEYSVILTNDFKIIH